MSDARLQLSEWFEGYWGQAMPISSDADLFKHCGIEGDDAAEFIDAFAARFGVNGDRYRWYFHHGEEGTSFGAMFVKPPYRRVDRMPITPDTLVEAIESSQWPLHYPPHEVPKVRWDIRINQALLGLPIIMLGLWAWKRFFV